MKSPLSLNDSKSISLPASSQALSRRLWLQSTLASSLAASASWSSALAQEEFRFTRPLKMIVPYPPGGAGDIVARMLTNPFSQALGQSVVVDNRGGGAQLIATDLAAKAAPDGYTLFLASTTHSINPSLIKQLPYDSLKDFSPITLVASSPMVWLVHPSVGVNTMGELIAKARANPSAINYGSSGPGSGGHLAVELLKSMSGVQMTHVPYKGAGPALSDLLSGQIQVVCTSPLPAMPHVKSGHLKALAMTSAKRTALAPELPTVAEGGFPDYQATLWYALMVQSRVPQHIQAKLYESVSKTLKGAETSDQFKGQGADVAALTPQATDAFIRAEMQRWSTLITHAQIKMDS